MFKMSYEEDLPYYSDHMISAVYNGIEYYCSFGHGFLVNLYSADKISDRSRRYDDHFFCTVVSLQEVTNIYQTDFYAEYRNALYRVRSFGKNYPNIIIESRGGNSWEADRSLGFTFDDYFRRDILETEKSKTELYGEKNSIYHRILVSYKAYKQDHNNDNNL